ncbi:MAG TPA: hypothetical protein DEO32_03195 [Ruminococcaceae bacterium]|nr:hypothetical protein [Oscillospiraceae bacterium]
MFGRAKKYKVNYQDGREFFPGAKDSYRAGETVVFYFTLVATDTNYTFYLNGRRFQPEYCGGKGYKISFVMPEGDVDFRVESKNTML